MATVEEVRASELRRGDTVNLVHEVQRVTQPRNGLPFLVVHTQIIDRHGLAVGRHKLTLYPDETVMRNL